VRLRRPAEVTGVGWSGLGLVADAPEGWEGFAALRGIVPRRRGNAGATGDSPTPAGTSPYLFPHFPGSRPSAGDSE
jgi:hypothetical protein